MASLKCFGVLLAVLICVSVVKAQTSTTTTTTTTSASTTTTTTTSTPKTSGKAGTASVMEFCTTYPFSRCIDSGWISSDVDDLTSNTVYDNTLESGDSCLCGK